MGSKKHKRKIKGLSSCHLRSESNPGNTSRNIYRYTYFLSCDLYLAPLHKREKKMSYIWNNICPSNGPRQSLGLLVSCPTNSPDFCQHATDMNFSLFSFDMFSCLFFFLQALCTHHHSASPVAFWKTKSFPLRFMIPSFRWNFHLFLFLFICFKKSEEIII